MSHSSRRKLSAHTETTESRRHELVGRPPAAPPSIETLTALKWEGDHSLQVAPSAPNNVLAPARNKVLALVSSDYQTNMHKNKPLQPWQMFTSLVPEVKQDYSQTKSSSLQIFCYFSRTNIDKEINKGGIFLWPKKNKSKCDWLRLSEASWVQVELRVWRSEVRWPQVTVLIVCTEGS